MFEATDNVPRGAVIKVVGVGGCGGNAIKYMIENTVHGVDFCAINTDIQDLRSLGPEVTCLSIGNATTRGLGAGADPNVGRAAAEESKEDIAQFLQHTNMLFIAAGMGGGTGTGSAPVIAAIAKSQNILTVAVVTKPFTHENRSKAAEEGLAELSKHVDTIIVVANQKLFKVMGKNATLAAAFAAANDILLGAVQGIADLITRSGLINVDFADVQTVMLGKGNAMMGTGIATGENRAEIATRNAIKSPLLEDIALNSAKGLLVNITADTSFRITEFNKINSIISENYAAKDAQIVMGTATDESMAGAIKVTVIATGVFARVQAAKDTTQASLASHVPTANDNTQPVQPTPSVAGSSAGQPPDSEDYTRYKAPAFLRVQAN